MPRSARDTANELGCRTQFIVVRTQTAEKTATVTGLLL